MKEKPRRNLRTLGVSASLCAISAGMVCLTSSHAYALDHTDAPLVSQDRTADIADFFAFVTVSKRTRRMFVSDFTAQVFDGEVLYVQDSGGNEVLATSSNLFTLVEESAFMEESAGAPGSPVIHEGFAVDIKDKRLINVIIPVDVLVFAVTVNPFSTRTEAPSFQFSSDVRYRVNFVEHPFWPSTSDNANLTRFLADSIYFTFQPSQADGPQQFTVTLPPQEVGGEIVFPSFSGDVTLPTPAPVPNEPRIAVSSSNVRTQLRAFAGPRDDTSFFDVVGFSRAFGGELDAAPGQPRDLLERLRACETIHVPTELNRPAQDAFGGDNVSAIVLEIPLSEIDNIKSSIPFNDSERVQDPDPLTQAWIESFESPQVGNPAGAPAIRGSSGGYQVNGLLGQGGVSGLFEVPPGYSVMKAMSSWCTSERRALTDREPLFKPDPSIFTDTDEVDLGVFGPNFATRIVGVMDGETLDAAETAQGNIEELGPFTQVDRMANPSLQAALFPVATNPVANVMLPANGVARDIFNFIDPAYDPEQPSFPLGSPNAFPTFLEASLDNRFLRVDREPSQTLLVPDVLTIAILEHNVTGRSLTTSYPNGRFLEDDVANIVLGSLYTDPTSFRQGALVTIDDGIDANDVGFLDEFPYLAPPHQAP